jgi:hypothetical protein
MIFPAFLKLMNKFKRTSGIYRTCRSVAASFGKANPFRKTAVCRAKCFPLSVSHNLYVSWFAMEKIENSETMEFMVRSTILDRPRFLRIDPEFVEFDDQDQVSKAPTRFLRTEIEGLRYGVKPIRGYRFRIGRIYCIDIRDASGHVIKIRLKSVYRVRIKLLEKKYIAIVNALFRYYFYDMTQDYLTQFRNGQTVELLGVSLSDQGVLFDRKVGRISWDFLGAKRYWHYYTLYSEETPNNYRAFVFLDDWNAGVLRRVIEVILKEKFPKRYPENSTE